MPIFIWGGDAARGEKKKVVEVGPSTNGKRTFLAVHGTGVWIEPEWARKVAASLIEYADREEKGEPHPVAGGIHT